MNQIFDIFIIGGGINGAGIARDAVGRGFKVFLAEGKTRKIDDFLKGCISCCDHL